MNPYHRWYCRSARWGRKLDERLLPWVLGARVGLGDDLLEVGPGPGLTTDRLRGRAGRVTAVEVDPKLAESLRERTRGTNVDVVTADATELPLPDGRFSAAVSLTMLHHLPSPAHQDRLLREVRRVLRPGGVFVGSDSTPSLAFRLAHVGDTMVPVDPAGWAARLVAAGFVDPRVDAAPGAFRFRARRPDE